MGNERSRKAMMQQVSDKLYDLLLKLNEVKDPSEKQKMEEEIRKISKEENVM